MIHIRNNVKIFGKGTQPMLFAHGFGSNQNTWRHVFPAFTDDYKIVLFDYVGSGKSDLSAYNPDRYSNLDGYAEDMLDVIDALELKDIILVGHSVSSMIGLMAAIKKPELFQKLIFIGPSPRYINDENYKGGFELHEIDEMIAAMEKDYNTWAAFLGAAAMKNPEQPALAEELIESFRATDPAIARRFAEAIFYSDKREELSKLKVPSLIIQCTDDLVAPVEVGEYMHQNMPQSTIRVIAATGHYPQMSAPEEVISVMKEYLGSGVLV